MLIQQPHNITARLQHKHDQTKTRERKKEKEKCRQSWIDENDDD
jgi:hypothetical protein